MTAVLSGERPICPAPTGRPRILVIDDDEDIGALLEQLLSEEGYEVTVVPDGAVALEATERRQPAVILLDLRMPNMDGAAFVSRYRERARPPASIIVVSGAFDGAEEARRLGAQGYVGKPFDLDQIVRQIRDRIAAT